MAYVLGFIYADGHLQDVPRIRGQYLRITSTDKDRLEFIRTFLESTHSIIQTPQPAKHYKHKFVLSIGSKTLYKDLISIGLHPAKSLNMTMPSVPKQYLNHFIRGYFDGDGCLFVEKKFSKKTGERRIHRLSLIFTSGSKIFLESLGERLVDVGCVDKEKIYKNGSSFQMRFSTKEALRVCELMYKELTINSYMKRKKVIFDEFKRIRKLPN